MAIDARTMQFIKQKAESNTPMDIVTPEKQKLYDQYQQYFKDQVQQKAQSGATLDRPNDWKNSLYNQFQGEASQNRVNSIFDQQTNALLAQLKAQQNRALGQVNQQKAELAPQYQAQRNQTDAMNMQNAQRLREAMASAGIASSGENVTAMTAMNNQRLGSINQLNLQEQQQVNDLDRRIADINNPAEQTALLAQIEADRARMLYDAHNRNQDMAFQRDQFNYQKQQDQAERAWREYTYNNMSASEKAQMEWAKAQYGEEQAWRMYQMQYQGELQSSMSQAELDFYKNAGFNGEVKGDGWIPNLKDYKITSQFGNRNDPLTGNSDFHRGIDLAVPNGTTLGSTVSGKVVSTSGGASYGNTVVIEDVSGNLHRFAHLDSVLVKVGQTVSKGSLIAKTGNSGRSTGAHLHYEVTSKGGALINPSIFLK